MKLDENLRNIHYDLKNVTYNHGKYEAFIINDPKPRSIHKSSVRDRVIHHAVYRVLYPYFDIKFIHDSYSCRKNKGTHKALNRFKKFHNKCSQNNTKTVYVLKCDIRKFFASIDHEILLDILKKHIHDEKLFSLLQNIVISFHTSGKPQSGLPLGNLTSQLLVNIYMNVFDQYVKHILKQKYYIRYADDFVIFSQNKTELENLIPVISKFLTENLKLNLHPDKVFIKTVSSGVDFLGFVHFPYHRVFRSSTKRRMIRNLEKSDYDEKVVRSYEGLCKWGNTYKLKEKIIKNIK